MKVLVRYLVVVLLSLCPMQAWAGALEDYNEARKNFLATAACMAAYSNRAGNMAATGFVQEGWRVEPHKMNGDKADVKFLLAWDSKSEEDKDSYLLAVAGTENVRDAKVDMRTNKVYFAGTTPEEFEANAARKDMPPDAPRVHEGFNQVTQLLLSLKSDQSNDALKGQVRMLSTILHDDKEDKVFLLGHSLGGAVVTLLAARLHAMGVMSNQIEVISLGAPSVGNEAFVKMNEGQFSLTRIVVAGDPVPQALRRVYGGYRHFGKEIVWQVPEALKLYTPHDMPVYMDIAMKKFHAARRQARKEGLLPVPEPIPGKPRMYVAPIKNTLPPALQGEFASMRECLLDQYEDILPGFVLDPGADSNAIPLYKAANAECDLLAIAEISAEKLQNGNDYTVSLTQTVYRVSDGSVASVGTYVSQTKVLTPMLALFSNAKKMSADSAAWSSAK